MPVCPSCAATVPDEFAFCGRCGAAVARPGPAEERRQVTILFCDLAGFTARADGADPEDVGAMLRPYHARLAEEIERFGGTLDKLIGDGVMAVFGAPVAHEDDPERAVRCGLAMLEAACGLGLEIRVGITTGEAVVAADDPRRAERVVGDVVNTASRIEGVAPVGGVVVGEPTWRATRRLFDYERLDPARVKGKADPLPLWRALAARGRLGPEAALPPLTPLAGRRAELDRLTGLWARTVASGCGGLVTVVGEAGIGKSRLVRELGATLDASPELVAWRQGRCLPYGQGVTFAALGEIVKANAGILESDDAETARAKLRDAVAAVTSDPAERRWLRQRLAPLAGLPGEGREPAERTEAFAAWRRFLEAAAARVPLVVVIEDLHWADPALLELLGAIANPPVAAPLLVVATARPELLERGAVPVGERIGLDPLDEAGTAELLGTLLPAAGLDPAAHTTLAERVGGNPLYAEEVVRMLAERRSDAATALPESLAALVGARLDTLPAHLRALVSDAAVVGRVFWTGTLAAMGDRDPAEVEAGLAELAGRQFVRPAPVSSLAGQAEHTFWHSVTRDVAYERIPRAARARGHTAAAAWIEATAGDRAADQAEIIAAHHVTALWLTRAARDAEGAAALTPAALDWLTRAGDRAMALDVARAATWFGQALELVPPGDAGRPAVLTRAGEAALQAGKLEEGGARFAEAIAGFLATGRPLEAGRAETSRARLLAYRGEARAARAAARTAVELLEAGPHGPELADAYAAVAGIALMAGDAATTIEWAGRAEALAAATGAGVVHQRALQYRGSARCDLGDLDGLADLRAALDLGLRLGLGHPAAVTTFNLGGQLMELEGVEAAERTYRDGIELCRRRGLMEVRIGLRVGVIECLFERGRWDEIGPAADEVVDWYERHGGGYVDVMATTWKARVLAWRGEMEAAAALIRRLLPQVRRIGDLQVLVLALPVAARVELGLGQPDAAADLAAECLAGTSDGPDAYRADPLPDLVVVALAAGRPELAAELVAGIEVKAARPAARLLAATAAIDEAGGDLDRAAEGWAAAAAAWAGLGARPDRAAALLARGRCLTALGRPGASGPLLQAKAILSGLGARPLLAEADALLAR